MQKQAGEAGNRSPRVVLVGMMGTGKTTVGKLVAARLGCGIRRHRRRGRVESWYLRAGRVLVAREEAFRQSESEALEVLLAREGLRRWERCLASRTAR